MLRLLLLDILHVRLLSLISFEFVFTIVKISVWLSLRIETIEISSVLLFFILLLRFLLFEYQILVIIVVIAVAFLIITLFLSMLFERAGRYFCNWFFRSRRTYRAWFWADWSLAFRNRCINASLIIFLQWIFFVFNKFRIVISNNNKFFVLIGHFSIILTP